MVLTAWHKLGTQGRARASLRRLKPLIYRSGLRTYAESSGDPESHQSRPPTPKVYGATGFSMKYITRDELAELIKSEKVAHKDYLVVDVRNDDYAGGNIKNCLNQPAGDFFKSNVDALVGRTKDVPLVIFHCALSQQRGPQAARIYEETRLSHDMLDDRHVPYEVKVLRGGFTEFQAKFQDDPQLVENWDKKVWGSDWSLDDPGIMAFLNGTKKWS